MLKTIIVSKNEIYSGTLVLINAKFPIRNENTNGLIPADMNFPEILIHRYAANALQMVFDKISAKKEIVPVSGYRSSREQTDIYQNAIKDHGEEFTKKYVALPNHSEHQSGLAIDLGLNKESIDFIRPDFPYEGISDDFRKAAFHYGFIERYPKDKQELTGISHEPWHFRYVGYPHSKIIKKYGYSLEEYIQFLKDYQKDCRFVYRETYGTEIEIYYVPACDNKTLITIPETCLYQISGNNIDGFIVTVWRKIDDKK